MTNSIINQDGKAYGAGYAVADALCNGVSATAGAVSKTAAVAVGATGVVAVGTVVVTATAAGATYRGTKHAVHETAEVSTSFFAGFGRAFKDRAAQRKAAKAAKSQAPAIELVVNNVERIKPRVRVIDGQMVQVLE